MVHFTWATKYEFHAGFLPNIRLKQIKQKITKGTLFDESQPIEQFENNILLRPLTVYTGPEPREYKSITDR